MRMRIAHFFQRLELIKRETLPLLQRGEGRLRPLRTGAFRAERAERGVELRLQSYKRWREATVRKGQHTVPCDKKCARMEVARLRLHSLRWARRGRRDAGSARRWDASERVVRVSVGENT